MDGPELGATHYFANAILRNSRSQTCDEHAFLLPSVIPKQSLDSYIVELDEVTGIFHVAAKYRHVSFRDVLELRDPRARSKAAYFVEFSNGCIAAVPRSRKFGPPIQEHSPVQVITHLENRQPTSLENSSSDSVDDNTFSEALSISQAKDIQVGDEVPSETAKSGTDHVQASVPSDVGPGISTSPVSASSVEISSGKSSSATYTPLSSVQGSAVSDANTIGGAPIRSIIPSIVQKLPSCSPDVSNMSHFCKALDVVHQPIGEHFKPSLSYLDLAPLSEHKDMADRLQEKYRFQSSVGDTPEIGIDAGSGELYLPLLCDADSPETSPNLAVDQVDAPTNSLVLCSKWHRDPFSIMDEINTNYCRIWTRTHPGKDYYLSTYDDASEQTAIEQFEQQNGELSSENFRFVRQYLRAFLKLWQEGLPRRPDQQHQRWTYGMHEWIVGVLAAKMIGCIPSDYYSDYDAVNLVRQPAHHINFLGDWVYERSYTPPEVSFWAAATTREKKIFGKKLPAVHYARVITAQAFKWVDPTQYLGKNIKALRKMKGSAMRNNATSDVKVVYQEVGTWNKDHYGEDDTFPDITPCNNRYEFAEKAQKKKYKYHQRPILIDNWEYTEHGEFNINDGGTSTIRHCSVGDYNKERPCLLKQELGAALAGKAAALEEKLEKKPLNKDKAVSILETVAEEDAVTEEDTDAGNGETASEAETDIEVNFDDEHEPKEYMQSNADLPGAKEPAADSLPPVGLDPPVQAEEWDPHSMYQEGQDIIARVKDRFMNRRIVSQVGDSDDDEAVVESDKESFDGDNGITDHSSVWPDQPDPSIHPKAAMLSRFSEEDNDESYEDLGFDDADRTSEEPITVGSHAIGSLEDGRYCSPSKMVLSRIDETITPVGSPSKDQDLGSWELNGAGVYETPRRIGAFERDGKDGSSALSPDIRPQFELSPPEADSFAGAMGPSWNDNDDDDDFASDIQDSSVKSKGQWNTDVLSRKPRSSPYSHFASRFQDHEDVLPKVRSRKSKSVSFVEEVDSDIEESKPTSTCKELVLFKAPKYSNLDILPSIERRLSTAMPGFVPQDVPNTVFTEASKTHSRTTSSSSEPWSSNTSNYHSRSSSLTDPWSDADFLEGLSAQVDAKQKGVTTSALTKLLYSSLAKRETSLAHAGSWAHRRIGSGDSTDVQNVQLEEIEEALDGKDDILESSTDLQTTGDDKKCDDTQASHTNTTPTASSPPLSIAHYSSIATTPSNPTPPPTLSICHYTVADIPPTPPKGEDDDDEMPPSEILMFGLPLALGLG